MWYFFLTLASSSQVELENCYQGCKTNGECHEIYQDLPVANETISADFLCKCYEGFTGVSCAECEYGRFGKNCNLCPVKDNKICNGKGYCDMGISASGKCKCFHGFNPNTDCFDETNFLELWHEEAKTLSLLLISLVACIILIHTIQKLPKQFLPSSCGAIILGAILGLIFKYRNPDDDLSSAFSFDPQTFFLVILPPIMLEAGFSLQKASFFSNFGTIMMFSVPGTVVSALLFGVGLYSLCNGLSLYEFSFIECMLFGTLISALDPVATLKIFEAMGLDPSLQSIVLGESVVNDAIVITMFKILSAHGIKDNSWVEVSGDFAYVLFGSCIIGILIGLSSALIFKYIDLKTESAVELSLFMLFSYLPFVLCEALSMSGILCMLFVGMTMSHYTKTWLSKEVSEAANAGITTFACICESFCFVYLGISISLSSSSLVLSVVLCCIILMLFTRAFVVFCFSCICNYYRTSKISFTHQCLIWVSGMRGAVAFSLALSFPTGNPDVIVSTTQYIILFTMLSMSLGIYPILKGLHFIEDLRPIFGHSDVLDETPEVALKAENWFEILDKKYLQKVFRKEIIIESPA